MVAAASSRRHRVLLVALVQLLLLLPCAVQGAKSNAAAAAAYDKRTCAATAEDPLTAAPNRNGKDYPRAATPIANTTTVLQPKITPLNPKPAFVPGYAYAKSSSSFTPLNLFYAIQVAEAEVGRGNLTDSGCTKKSCSRENGRCVNGLCVCKPAWTGDACKERRKLRDPVPRKFPTVADALKTRAAKRLLGKTPQAVLRVLLVTDDITKPSHINLLSEALADAGHRVTLVHTNSLMSPECCSYHTLLHASTPPEMVEAAEALIERKITLLPLLSPDTLIGGNEKIVSYALLKFLVSGGPRFLSSFPSFLNIPSFSP